MSKIVFGRDAVADGLLEFLHLGETPLRLSIPKDLPIDAHRESTTYLGGTKCDGPEFSLEGGE